MNLAWDDALWAAAALSVDPAGLRGVWLRAPHGPVRDRWLALLALHHPRLRRLPGHADPERLLGGLDLGATLHAGKAVYQPGLLQQTEPTLLLLPMAERLADDTAAIVGQVLDQGQLTPGGQTQAVDTHIGLVALDESLEDEPPLTQGLQERLALWLDFRALTRASEEAEDTQWLCSQLPVMDHQAVRDHALGLTLSEAQLQALVQTAQALGVQSLRACVSASRLARVLAALRGSDAVAQEDLARAARLVLTPRATQWPSNPQEEPHPPPEPEPPSPPEPDPEAAAEPSPPPPPPDPEPQAMAELLLEAALATLPEDVLASLAKPSAARPGRGQGRQGDRHISHSRGSPLPAHPGHPRQGARLHVLATLHAAVPRQKLRRPNPQARAKLAVRPQDFHVHRYARHSPTCLIFAIDASGSAALHRLAEAKGAVETLLTQSYARRDQVCVVGFRGTTAEVLLPPTKSLVRAKRCLSGLPGGGGTPLASAIEQCLQVALAEKRQGHTPSLVMLSDGRPNVSLQGQGGRAQALEDALTLARVWQRHQLSAIWLDTSARPEPQAQQLADAMGARYLPLPLANGQRMAQAIQAVQSGVDLPKAPAAQPNATSVWRPNPQG